jgi:uncharacterized surface protein with fasciclin (FAS1) repeats
MSRLALLPALCLLLALTACGPRTAGPPVDDEQTEDATGDSVVDEAERAGLTTFLTAAHHADLVGTLSAGGPYTVFAPSDEAFNALPAGLLDRFLEADNRDALRSLLTYHVLSASVRSGDLSGDRSFETVNGESLTVNATDAGVTLTDALGSSATVVSADLDATNGVLHVIDAVLLPATPEELLGDPLLAEEEPADAPAEAL